MKKLKCAIIGCGGLGKSHMRNLLQMEDIELVALCDIDPEQFTKATATNLGESAAMDISGCRLYTVAEEMLEKEELDFVVTALPTFIHEKYAVMALNKGLHVFSEKPMGRTVEACKNMIDAAKKNNKLLSIGQCLRFDHDYNLIKDAYDSGKYGKLERLTLTRYSYPPIWAWENWFMDFDRSGGAALDLHVHDVDFLNYLLGRPDAVTSQANHRPMRFSSISTMYHYNDGPMVNIIGDWSLPQSHGFHADFWAVFEKATLMRTGGKLMLFPIDGDAVEIEHDGSNMYYTEMEYFIKCIRENRENDIAPAESTMQSIEIAFAEMESAETGKTVTL